MRSISQKRRVQIETAEMNLTTCKMNIGKLKKDLRVINALYTSEQKLCRDVCEKVSDLQSKLDRAVMEVISIIAENAILAHRLDAKFKVIHDLEIKIFKLRAEHVNVVSKWQSFEYRLSQDKHLPNELLEDNQQLIFQVSFKPVIYESATFHVLFYKFPLFIMVATTDIQANNPKSNY